MTLFSSIPTGITSGIQFNYRIISEGFVLFENINSLSEAFIVIPEILAPDAEIQVEQTTIVAKVSDSFFDAMTEGEGAAIFTTVLQRSKGFPNIWAISLNIDSQELRLLLDLSDLYINRCIREAQESGHVALLLLAQGLSWKSIQLELDANVASDLLRAGAAGQSLSEGARLAELVCLATMLGNKENFPVSIPGYHPEEMSAMAVLTPRSAMVFQGFVGDAVKSVTEGLTS